MNNKVKKALDNVLKFYTSINKQIAENIKIQYNDDDTFHFQSENLDWDITGIITDKDIMLVKEDNNKYIITKRILFNPISFLTIPEIHQIEDFILYN